VVKNRKSQKIQLLLSAAAASLRRRRPIPHRARFQSPKMHNCTPHTGANLHKCPKLALHLQQTFPPPLPLRPQCHAPRKQHKTAGCAWYVAVVVVFVVVGGVMGVDVFGVFFCCCWLLMLLVSVVLLLVLLLLVVVVVETTINHDAFVGLCLHSDDAKCTVVEESVFKGKHTGRQQPCCVDQVASNCCYRARAGII